MSASGKYLLIDTETTGLSPSRHGLTQLAAVAMDEHLTVVGQFCQDVCPPEGVEVSQEALDLTGFTAERISQGLSYQEVTEQFVAFIQEHFSSSQEITTIGQFYPFDFAVLDHLFSQTTFKDSNVGREILGNSFIDTKALVLGLNLKADLSGKPRPFPITSLSKPGGLKDTLNISGYQAHDALGDVLATREVLLKLLDYLP
jgi:DNA polymerase III epsilon subunit-like protein